MGGGTWKTRQRKPSRNAAARRTEKNHEVNNFLHIAVDTRFHTCSAQDQDPIKTLSFKEEG